MLFERQYIFLITAQRSVSRLDPVNVPVNSIDSGGQELINKQQAKDDEMLDIQHITVRLNEGE